MRFLVTIGVVSWQTVWLWLQDHILTLFVITFFAALAIHALVFENTCPSCKRRMALRRTGEKRNSSRWRYGEEGRKCKYCGHVGWRKSTSKDADPTIQTCEIIDELQTRRGIAEKAEMTTFDVYTHRTKGYEAVKQGFSWPAFFFPWIWAFVKELWLPGCIGLLLHSIFLVINEEFEALMSEGRGDEAGMVLLFQIAYSLVISIVFGVMGNRWRSNALKRRGYQHIRAIAAETPDDAIDMIAGEENGTTTA